MTPESTAPAPAPSCAAITSASFYCALAEDRTAFAELFRHHGPLIKGFAIQHANSRFPIEAADELVQEVMLKVWLKAKSFEPSKASANTWVFTVMRNCRIDLLRRITPLF